MFGKKRHSGELWNILYHMFNMWWLTYFCQMTWVNFSIQNLTHSFTWLIVKEPCDVSPVSTFLLSWGFTSKFGLFSCLLKKLTFQSFIFNFCRHRRRRHGWWKLRYLSAFWYCWLYISSTKRKTLLYTMVYLYLVFPHKKPLEKPLIFFRF